MARTSAVSWVASARKSCLFAESRAFDGGGDLKDVVAFGDDDGADDGVAARDAVEDLKSFGGADEAILSCLEAAVRLQVTQELEGEAAAHHARAFAAWRRWTWTRSRWERADPASAEGRAERAAPRPARGPRPAEEMRGSDAYVSSVDESKRSGFKVSRFQGFKVRAKAQSFAEGVRSGGFNLETLKL